jgi:signal transduction histidine kinase
MLRFQSTMSRIISLHVLAIGATSVAMPLALYLLLASTATDLHQRALRETADTIAHYLTQAPGGDWALELPADLRVLYGESYGRYAYAIIDKHGRVLFSSLPGNTPVLPSDPLTPARRFFQGERDRAPYYGASIPETVLRTTVWVEVIQDLEHRDVLIDDIVASFFKRVGWITIPILLFLLAIDIFIFRRALRPVIHASTMARAITPARLDVRLPTRNLPSEVRPLVDAVNQALDRLERGFRIQREFTADAAHELRTPLAILRARVDTLDSRGAAKSLLADIDGMSRIVNQLLESAELEDFTVEPGETADILAVCTEIVSFVAPLAVAQGRSIALTGSDQPVPINGRAEALLQAVRNLAENALHHTAVGTTVEIDVGRDGCVRVLDRGPGIPPNERELVFRRFWRRDRRRGGGAGLGLSIVARIVEAHRGSIAISDRSGGGAVFTVRFVPAPDAGAPHGGRRLGVDEAPMLTRAETS